jgi:hypothetical protein
VHDGPFAAHLGHQLEFKLLEVAQAAVHQLGGTAGGAGGEILHFHQPHVQAPGPGVEGNARAGNAAADHEQVEGRLLKHLDVSRAPEGRKGGIHGLTGRMIADYGC